MRNIIEATAPWALPAGVDVLDAVNVVPTFTLPVHVLLCTAAATLTLRVFLRTYVAAVARQAPVAAALERGYELARDHCRADHGGGRHRAAVGEITTRAFPQLRLVEEHGTVYRSGTVDVAALTPVTQLRHQVPSPRPSRRGRGR